MIGNHQFSLIVVLSSKVFHNYKNYLSNLIWVRPIIQYLLSISFVIIYPNLFAQLISKGTVKRTKHYQLDICLVSRIPWQRITSFLNESRLWYFITTSLLLPKLSLQVYTASFRLRLLIFESSVWLKIKDKCYLWMTILETGYKIIKKSADTHQNLLYKYIANKLFFFDYAN